MSFLQWGFVFSSFLSLSVRSASPFLWGSFPCIVPSVASQPSICTNSRNPLDASPIKTLLEVLERAMSYENTVQVSFPHKCNRLNSCNALNVEVAITFQDISSFRCLHNSVVFPETLLAGIDNYSKYSRGSFAPRDPQSVDQFAFSPRTSNLRVKFWFTHIWIFNHPRTRPKA